MRIEAKGRETLAYGDHFIDLSCLEQLVETGQTRAIGRLMYRYAEKFLDPSTTLREGLEQAMAEIDEKGLDGLMPYKVGNLTRPRLFEVAGAINRLRGLKMK